MTGEAIIARLMLSVTIHAGAHAEPLQRLRRRPDRLANLSMAHFALQAGPRYVSLVSEENMIWHPIEPLPWDLLVPLCIFSNLSLFSTLGHGLFMTA